MMRFTLNDTSKAENSIKIVRSGKELGSEG